MDDAFSCMINFPLKVVVFLYTKNYTVRNSGNTPYFITVFE